MGIKKYNIAIDNNHYNRKLKTFAELIEMKVQRQLQLRTVLETIYREK